jgi:hypothetical protein
VSEEKKKAKMRVYTTDRYYMRGRGGEYAMDPDAYIRGRGIASIFGRIFSSVVPLVKGAFNIGSRAVKSDAGQALVKEVKKSATRAGLNVVSDALQGKNVLDSTKRELARATQSVGKKVDQMIVPNGQSASKPRRQTARRGRVGKAKPKLGFKTGKYGGGKRGKKKAGKRSASRGGGKKKSPSKTSRRGGKQKRVRISTLFD